MARLFTCGFELGEAIEQNAGVVDQSSLATIQSDYKRTGSYALKTNYGISATAGYVLIQSLPTQPDELYLRAAIMHGPSVAPGTVPHCFVALFDQTNCHLSVGIRNTDSRLVLRRGGTGLTGQTAGTTLAVGNAVLCNYGWYVVELYAKISNGAGTAVVKVNNVTDIGYTGDTAASGNEYVDIVCFGGGGVGAGVGFNLYLDDLAINDITGSYENTWCGQGGVYLLKPEGEGSLADWTPSAGTVHYQLVDDIPDDASSTYITSETVGHQDSFTIGDLPATVTEVDLAQVLYQGALDYAGVNSIKDLVVHEGTAYGGSVTNITTTTPNYQLCHGTIHYTQPGGTVLWTKEAIEALEIGVEVAA